MRSLLFALATLLPCPLTACGPEGANMDEPETEQGGFVSSDPNEPSSQNADQVDWTTGSCTEPRQQADLLGLTSVDLERSLAEPELRETFALGTRQDEFHLQLQNTYSLSDASNAGVEIAEWTWSNGDCRLTVWLHRMDGGWQSFDSMLWHKDAEF